MKIFASIDTEKSFSRAVRFSHNRGMRPLLVTEADYANLSLLESPRLRRWLARATRVWSDAMPANVVTMNTRVACTDLATGERRVRFLAAAGDRVAAARRRAAARAHRGADLPARAGPAQQAHFRALARGLARRAGCRPAAT